MEEIKLLEDQNLKKVVLIKKLKMNKLKIINLYLINNLLKYSECSYIIIKLFNLNKKIKKA